ncbi:MAG TPA: hypothetical protein VJ022_00175 [Anaerolineales bacterium]|nr:hypothetical protein [Anaerolineales bacterium]
MFDTITLTYNSNSNSQKVDLLPTSANQYFIVSAFDQYNILDWSQLLGVSILQLKMRQLLKAEAYQTMLASEIVLRADWDSPEEDEAWADL